MTTDADEPITLVFLGHASAAQADRAAAYEDSVLALLVTHGARLVYRGRRRDDQDVTLPYEVHVIWFPGRHALDAYLADERRVDLLGRFGEVFTSKYVVEMDPISAVPFPR